MVQAVWRGAWSQGQFRVCLRECCVYLWPTENFAILGKRKATTQTKFSRSCVKPGTVSLLLSSPPVLQLFLKSGIRMLSEHPTDSSSFGGCFTALSIATLHGTTGGLEWGGLLRDSIPVSLLIYWGKSRTFWVNITGVQTEIRNEHL
jgi:hypothetical protein